jgi:quercetin dioxygenase-like cupin family protein
MVDDGGRSCILKNVSLASELVETAGFRHANLYTAPSVPPPSRPKGNAELLPDDLVPGQVQWSVVEYAPHQSYPMHHTDTIDFDVVLEGSIELQVDAGTQLLNAGDCALVAGVDHGWKAGPKGCLLSVAFVGTPPA